MNEKQRKNYLEFIDNKIKQMEYEQKEFNQLFYKIRVFDEKQLNNEIKQLKKQIKDKKIKEIEFFYKLIYKEK